MGAVLIGAAAHAVLPRYASTYESSCWASLLTDQQAVQTKPWDRSEVLGAELDGYTAVHWQVRRPESFLTGIPEPGACEYQLVLNLEPTHARRLTAAIESEQARHQQRFDSVTTRILLAQRAAAEARFPNKRLPWQPQPFIWPQLEQFVPAEGRWENWGGCCPYPTNRPRRLYVNPKHAVAVVTFSLD